MNYIRKNIHRPNTVGAFGGDKRDRTADLLNAIQALSQLSYTPERYNITIYVYKFQDLFLKIKNYKITAFLSILLYQVLLCVRCEAHS